MSCSAFHSHCNIHSAHKEGKGNNRHLQSGVEEGPVFFLKSNTRSMRLFQWLYSIFNQYLWLLIRLKHQLLISKSTSLKHAGNILPVSAIFKLYKDDKNYWLLWSLRSHSIRKNYHHSNFRTSSVCEVLRSLDACCNSLVAILLIYHSPKFWNLLASGNDNRYFNLFTQTIELHINHWDGDHFQEPKYNLDKDFR